LHSTERKPPLDSAAEAHLKLPSFFESASQLECDYVMQTRAEELRRRGLPEILASTATSLAPMPISVEVFVPAFRKATVFTLRHHPMFEIRPRPIFEDILA